MYCEKCGSQIEDNIEKCPKCGHEIKKEYLENDRNNIKRFDLKKVIQFIRRNLKYIYYILAVLVFFMFIEAASNISEYGINISNIESIGGKTLEEAYYSELGGIYAGYATVVRGIGIFLSSILVWLGVHVRKDEKK